MCYDLNNFAKKMGKEEIKLIVDVTDPTNGKVIGEVPQSINTPPARTSWLRRNFGFSSFIGKGDKDIAFQTKDGRSIQTVDAYELNDFLTKKEGLPLEDDLGF